MAALSDQLLVVTILAYTAAMLGYAAEYAFGARGMVARAAGRPVAVESLVGTPGSPEPVEAAASLNAAEAVDAPPPPTDPMSPESRRNAAWAGRLAVAATVAGALAQVA